MREEVFRTRQDVPLHDSVHQPDIFGLVQDAEQTVVVSLFFRQRSALVSRV